MRRERLIESLKDRWEARRKHRLLRWVLGELKDPLDPIEMPQERSFQIQFEKLANNRCANDQGHCRYLDTCKRMETFLSDKEERPCFNAEEFKNEFGVSRESFWNLHELIEDHQVFTGRSNGLGRKQMPVSHQMLVLLSFLRAEG